MQTIFNVEIRPNDGSRHRRLTLIVEDIALYPPVDSPIALTDAYHTYVHSTYTDIKRIVGDLEIIINVNLKGFTVQNREAVDDLIGHMQIRGWKLDY